MIKAAEVVWDIVQNDLGPLRTALIAIRDKGADEEV